jgi:hypothetical protein
MDKYCFETKRFPVKLQRSAEILYKGVYDRMKLLQDLITTLDNHPTPSKCLVIFDIDSTLLCVSPRTQQILRDFALEAPHKEAYPKECSALKEVVCLPTDWGIRQTTERLQLTDSPLEFQKQVRDYWMRHFFSNEYLHLDEPYAGAVNFTNRVLKTGSEIRYLTARDFQRMGEGTVKSLKSLGFPDPDHDRVQLFMKQDRNQSDSTYKVDELSRWDHHWDAIWYFENEPVILHDVERCFPDIELIFVDSVHSHRAQVSNKWAKIGMGYPGFES